MILSTELHRCYPTCWADIQEGEIYLTFDITLISQTKNMWPVPENTFTFVLCTSKIALCENEELPNERSYYKHTFLTEDGTKWVDTMSGCFSTPYYSLSDIKEYLDENLKS